MKDLPFKFLFMPTKINHHYPRISESNTTQRRTVREKAIIAHLIRAPLPLHMQAQEQTQDPSALIQLLHPALPLP
jgi:hypothetical protein